MDSNKNGNSGEIKETDSGCGPGCDCGKTEGGSNIKKIAVLIVILAVLGIFIYKAKTSGSKQDSVNVSASTGFNTPISSEKVDTPPTSVQPVLKSSDADLSEKAASKAEESDTPAPEKDVSKNETPTAAPSIETKQPVVKPNEDKKMIGEFLDSFRSLNKVAVSQDGVFIFVPGKDDKTVKKEISDAVIAAEKTLKTKGIKIGLFTLETNSPDYPVIAKQVESPGILVAVKGKGMGAVSGEITEEKLLQAFVASMNAGGGCGSGGGGCGPVGCP